MFTIKGKFSEATVYIDDVDAGCISQIQLMLNHPTFTNPVKIMPDTHEGKGSVIGFTMPMSDSVIPNVVGVDIGCGVHFAEFPMHAIDVFDLLELDARIREVVPFGHVVQKDHVHYKTVKDSLFLAANTVARSFTNAFNTKYATSFKAPLFDEVYFEKRCKAVEQNINNAKQSICSVGGGNHYLEWGKTAENRLWFSIHCGSRHFGLCVAKKHQKIAVECINGKRGSAYQNEIQRIRSKYSGSQINEKIKELRGDLGLNGQIPKGMEYLSGQEMYNYLMDMVLAQCYADMNRQAILNAVVKIIKIKPIRVQQTVHNYINFSDMIVRKGAISSSEGELVIIPINMEYGSLLCTGKGNPEWNYSAPHGAGRILSRRAAKDTLDLEEFKDRMKGIASTSVTAATLDEAPGAYKNPKVIIAAIEPTVKIIDRIVPVLNMKDVSESSE